MKIKVTAKHIKNGKRMLSGSCPVSLAAKDATKSDDVSNDGKYITIKGEKYPLPEFVKIVTRIYDFTGNMQPFEFDIKELK